MLGEYCFSLLIVAVEHLERKPVSGFIVWLIALTYVCGVSGYWSGFFELGEEDADCALFLGKQGLERLDFIFKNGSRTDIVCYVAVQRCRRKIALGPNRASWESIIFIEKETYRNAYRSRNSFYCANLRVKTF